MSEQQYIEELMEQSKIRREAIEEFKTKVWVDLGKRITECSNKHLIDQEDLLEEMTFLLLHKGYSLKEDQVNK